MPEDTPEQLDGIRNNAKQEDFRMKNKTYEMILYAYPALEQFPKADRKLADQIREAMLNVFHLVIQLENKHYKKTTLGELDTELDVLRHFVRLAADPQLKPDKKPCGEIDKETLDRSVASYRGIMKHFDSYGLRQSLNETYKKEVTRDNANSTDDFTS